MRHPLRSGHLAAVAAVAATLAFGATRVRADVVPEDRRRKPCTAPGQTCDSAGPEEDQAGTCVAATCVKEMPTRDGGTVSVKFGCFHCAAGGFGRATPQPKANASGCAVAPEGAGTGSLAIMVLLIAALFSVRREYE